jgi:hypothetical protein
MSFYNQQHFLENVRDKEEMQIKEDARLFANASSPEKKRLMRLANIPETAPGPNAFAQQEERMEMHRLNSNAFYQQEVQRRMASPPALTHPALRQRSLSDPPTPPRASSCTTMSPFINAGMTKENSSPLKLVPSGANLAEPTTRGFIEERREQQLHDMSASEDDRTPVFVSPSTFARSVATPTRRSEKHKEVTIAELPSTELPSKTPKRSIFEKLRLNTSFRNSNTSPSTVASAERSEIDSVDAMPVKAKAVLGTSPTKKKGRTSFGSSPSKSNLPRSPSKRKGLFSRKPSGLVETATTSTRSKSALSTRSIESDQPPRTASTVTKTPPTAFSDPTHYSYSYKTGRQTSQAHSDGGNGRQKDNKTCSVTRSQSLKYFDHAIPPTPPTKDTPPEEKARREAELVRNASRLPFHDQHITPSKSTQGLVSTNERVSPTRFGSYGHREMPTLVTRPSMYSLHASVVPCLNDAATFEEMKARVDGLGLEGFSLPPETMRSPKLGSMYSPSIYSTDWAARPNSAFVTGTPPIHHPAQHTKQSSDDSRGSSSGATIQVIYPELAKDPSFSDITAGVSKEQRGRVEDHLDVTVPWHGRTHSRDHSIDSRHSKDSSIFAHHVDEDLDDKQGYDSPTSFTHASATPSPLHTLPATVYAPPPRNSSKQRLLTPAHANARRDRGLGLGLESSSRASSKSPSRRKEIFDNVPSLPAQTQATSCSGSPVDSLQTGHIANDVDVDPQKSSANKSPAADKLDRMMEMLDQLKSRNNEITNIRDEMRASNARIGDRLAAIENQQRGSPAPSSQGSDEHSRIARECYVSEQEHMRVSTNTAHDFYRMGQNAQPGGFEDVDPEESLQADTITELRETNSRLLQMVSGFAERLKCLERKSGGNIGL